MDKKILKYSILLCVFLMALSVWLGYATAVSYPKQAGMAVDGLSSSLGFVKNLNSFQIFLFIFLNNSIKSFIMLLLGIFFCFIPLIFVLFNGYMIGIVLAVSKNEIGLSETILSVLPHGLFELAGILFASGLGVWLGIRFFQKLKYRLPIRPYWNYAVKNFFIFVLPLLLLAALIETYLTSMVVNFFD